MYISTILKITTKCILFGLRWFFAFLLVCFEQYNLISIYNNCSLCCALAIFINKAFYWEGKKIQKNMFCAFFVHIILCLRSLALLVLWLRQNNWNSWLFVFDLSKACVLFLRNWFFNYIIHIDQIFELPVNIINLNKRV